MKKHIAILLLATAFFELILYSCRRVHCETKSIEIIVDKGVVGFAAFGMSRGEIMQKCHKRLHSETYDYVYGDAHFDKSGKLYYIGFGFNDIKSILKIDLSVKVGSTILTRHTTKQELIHSKDIQLKELGSGYYQDRNRKMLFMFDQSDTLSGFTIFRDARQ